MKAITPYDYNIYKLDTEYRYLFGIDARSCPNADWVFKKEDKDSKGGKIDIFKTTIKKDSDENSVSLFPSCELRVYEKFLSFTFSGCKLSRENMQRLFQIIERYYIDNSRIDPNYSFGINRRYWYEPDLVTIIDMPLVSGGTLFLCTSPKTKKLSVDIRVPKQLEDFVPQHTTIKRILIYDIETSGINPYYNSILQLSYQIVEFKKWRVTKSVNHYFQWPEDKTRVDWEAIEVNNLSWAFLQKQQLSNQKDALIEFYQDLASCQLAVAHNADFDRTFIEQATKEFSVKTKVKWPNCVDTMKDTTELCGLSPRKNNLEWKWPKLEELAYTLKIKCSDLSLHDSQSDVELIKRCLKKLCKDKYYVFRYE